MRHFERDEDVTEVFFSLGLFRTVTMVLSMLIYKRKEESVLIENYNYRQQIGEKFGLEKVSRNMKKSQ